MGQLAGGDEEAIGRRGLREGNQGHSVSLWLFGAAALHLLGLHQSQDWEECSERLDSNADHVQVHFGTQDDN